MFYGIESWLESTKPLYQCSGKGTNSVVQSASHKARSPTPSHQLVGADS